MFLIGLLTRFHAHPAAWLHRLPDSLSFEEGALLEPLVVALAAVEKTGLSLGDTLLIWYALNSANSVLSTDIDGV